jgi:small subunit ribosomal protein S16
VIKLRLKRFGKKNQSSFRIVAVNSTSRREGKPLEELGFYNPSTKVSRLDAEGIKSRIMNGAQPTDTVRSILIKANIITK